MGKFENALKDYEALMREWGIYGFDEPTKKSKKKKYRGWIGPEPTGYTLVVPEDEPPPEPEPVAYMRTEAENALAVRQGLYVPPRMVINPKKDSGITFGHIRDPDTGQVRYVGRNAKHDGHIAVFGGSGAGKTTGIALPTMKAWRHPLFTIDFKGDLVNKRTGPNTKVLYLLNGVENTFYYGPFDYIRNADEEDLIPNSRELANAIIPLPINTPEPFWIQGARSVLTGAMVYYLQEGLDFVETVIEIKSMSLTELVEKITKKEANGTVKHPDAAACINKDISENPKMLASISEELHQHIAVFATDKVVQDVLSAGKEMIKSPIFWEDLEHGDIIIRIDQSRLEQWSGVVRMMLAQLVRTLERRPDKYEPGGEKIEPTLLLLDEFPQYGKMDVITSAMKVLRSKNVTFCLFCQSLADLDETYGEATRRTILDNCPYQAILGANDAETQQYFSSRVGVVKLPKRGVNLNYKINGAEAGFSASMNEAIEPTIFPHEFGAMDDIVLVHPEGFSRVNKFLPDKE